MEDIDIDLLLAKGYWVSVTPVMSKGKWEWTCGVYKKGKKTGNWVTNNCKTHTTPNKAYKWALDQLETIVS